MRSAQYEQALNKQGVSWTYVEKVSLSDINLERGIRNQARLENPIEEDLVEQYVHMLKDKVEAPAVVLHDKGTKASYIPIDGNQRLAAKKQLKYQYTDAYLVHTSDQMVADRLTFSWNNLVNGKRLTFEESVEHALYFFQNYGLSLKEVAKEWGINYNQLVYQARLRELKGTLEQNGIKIPQPFDMRKIYDLGPLISVGEDIFVEAAKAVIETGMTSRDAIEIPRIVRRAKTAQDKIQAIRDYVNSDTIQQRKAETKGGTVKKVLPRNTYLKLLRKLESLGEDYDKSALRPIQAEFKQARGTALEVVNKIIEVFGLGPLMSKDKEAS